MKGDHYPTPPGIYVDNRLKVPFNGPDVCICGNQLPCPDAKKESNNE